MRKAFTLIELLVVISIIALLIAILLPALSSAREQGQRVACLAQMSQMQAAQVMYAQDNDDELVKSYKNYGSVHLWMPMFWRGWVGVGRLWSDDYISTPEALWCPSNTNPVIAFNGDYGFRANPDATISSPTGFGRPPIKHTYTRRDGVKKLSSPEYNSGTALMADGFSWTPVGNRGGWTGHYWEEYEGYAVRSHHKVGYNVAYLDGSVNFYADHSENIAALRITDAYYTADQVRMENEVWLPLFDR